ncbi:MAG: poly(3-hydroxybutyrate) depolymerase [Gammaproteobacteria bacterium]|nr:MAG: poly(3-hydroxybutyrate) depolymerase [Gammaproteobacteria bacterium]
MSVIDIQRHHTLDHEHAIETADKLAKSLADRFDLDYAWQGDTLSFSRVGLKGKMTVEPETIYINLQLGILLRPLKGKLEREIHSHLDGLIDTA